MNVIKLSRNSAGNYETMALQVYKAIAGGSCLLSMLMLFVLPAYSQDPASPIAWHAWSDQLFAQAGHDHKFVLLELGSAWCRECTAMDEQTYVDPNVRTLAQRNFLATRVDRSARPDLSNRYHGYDQPVIVIFNADGDEIVKLQGYRSVAQMGSILQAVIDDPSPGPSATQETEVTYSTSGDFPPALLGTLQKEFHSQYAVPEQFSSFGVQSLDADWVAYATQSVPAEREEPPRFLRDALAAARLLLDPIWGGSYQSLVIPIPIDGKGASRYVRVQMAAKLDANGSSWNDPHFEKPLFVQAQALHIYASSFGRWHIPEYLSAAQSVHRYVSRFMISPEGAFYTGQEAGVPSQADDRAYYSMNDAKRLETGTPAIDGHAYARENGWMIEALCELYAVSGDKAALAEAKRAADWLTSHRRSNGGGFLHDEGDAMGPYLGDTLAVGQAFLALYRATGDRGWLQRAAAAERFIAISFGDGPNAGFVGSMTSTDPAHKPRPDPGENADLARFAESLFQYTGDSEIRETALRAQRYLATPAIAMTAPSATILLVQGQLEHLAHPHESVPEQ
jgi:uncharacterized protein